MILIEKKINDFKENTAVAFTELTNNMKKFRQFLLNMNETLEEKTKQNIHTYISSQFYNKSDTDLMIKDLLNQFRLSIQKQ